MRKELPLPGVHEMAKASGCLKVEEQLRRVKSSMHVFGHTHFPWDMCLDEVRYFSWPLGSPAEQARRIHNSTEPFICEAWEPLLVF